MRHKSQSKPVNRPRSICSRIRCYYYNLLTAFGPDGLLLRHQYAFTTPIKPVLIFTTPTQVRRNNAVVKRASRFSIRPLETIACFYRVLYRIIYVRDERSRRNRRRTYSKIRGYEKKYALTIYYTHRRRVQDVHTDIIVIVITAYTFIMGRWTRVFIAVQCEYCRVRGQCRAPRTLY